MSPKEENVYGHTATAILVLRITCHLISILIEPRVESWYCRSGIETGSTMTLKPEATGMEYDQDKVDEMTLALLSLTSFRDPGGVRAWKGQDWDTMERLHSKGYISDPKSKAKSVVLSEEGEKRSKELFVKHFALKR
jgi:hypothetical protein